MRKIISYFIKYHVAVNVVIFAFVIFGVLGVLSLKSSFFPLIDSKNIEINITYPGASPLEIEEGIVLQIEDNLKGLEGIDRVTSVSRENSGTINVEIKQGENIDFILQEVKNAVDQVPSFPTGMEPLVVSKRKNIRETLTFSVSGDNISLVILKQITRKIENDLRGIEGISQVDITGYPQEEIEIAVREKDLLAYNLTFNEVSQAVSQTSILATGGNIKTNAEEYLIRANNRSYYGNELDNAIVRANSNGGIIRLRDVADVRDRFSETPNASFFNGNLSVNVRISNTNTEDLISSADRVKEYIEEYNQKYNNIQLNVLNDSSVPLKQRTQLLTENAIIGIVLVVFFLSLFLNTRVAFWVAFGLPIAFLGMFIFAGSFGVTINVLSLFGMIIVIGILVDDGIVIGENIYQHYEKGKSPIQAAIDGTLEVIPPVISAIMTTILAFSTFFFLDSRIGEFFSEVSTVVVLTLVVSLVEALIILPAHLAHSKALHKETLEEVTNSNTIQKFFARMRDINKIGDRVMVFMRDKLYSPALRFTLNNKFFTFSIFAILFILTRASIMGGIVKTSTFPRVASDRILVTLTMPQGTNEHITDSIIQVIENIALEVGSEYTDKQTGNLPVMENIVRAIGPGSSSAQLYINLLPGEDRDFSSPEITNTLRDRVGAISGTESLIFGSGGNFGGSPVSVSLLSNNIVELKAAKQELKAILSQNPLLKDINDNDPAGIKEIKIELKENAYLLGLNLREVMSQVRAGFFGVQAQRFQRGQDEVRVWVRYDKNNRTSISDLDEMRIVTQAGNRIPFDEIANYEIIRGDVAVNHLDGLREIQVNADLADLKASNTDILEDIKMNIIPRLQSKYPTIKPLYEGQNREAGRLQRSAAKVFPIIIFLIYAVIAFTFRSYSQPLLLLLLIPFSVIGVAWGHYIHDFPINVLSWLGIIALIGIMVNDGLVLIGKFNNNLQDGMKYDEALYEAGRSRFRAIFLTSLTTVAGLAPLLLEKSRQAQFLKPMAISISYGIAIATILTLIMLPLFLAASNYLKVKIKWLITGNTVSKEEVERAIKELEGEEYEE